MKILKEGTAVKLTKSYLKWYSENADSLYGYPDLIKPRSEEIIKWIGNESVQDQLTSYFMKRYSFDRNLDVYGVIIMNNNAKDQDFAYLIWMGNELGEETCYVSPENLKVV